MMMEPNTISASQQTMPWPEAAARVRAILTELTALLQRESELVQARRDDECVLLLPEKRRLTEALAKAAPILQTLDLPGAVKDILMDLDQQFQSAVQVNQRILEDQLQSIDRILRRAAGLSASKAPCPVGYGANGSSNQGRSAYTASLIGDSRF
jgi:hypothetical protein